MNTSPRSLGTIAAQAASVIVLAGSAVAVSAAQSHALPYAGCANQASAPYVMHASSIAGTRPAGTLAVVRVDLAHEGWLRNVRIVTSSGNPGFDAAAVRAAQTTAFVPAARGCVAIDSRFTVAYAANAAGHVVATVDRTSSIAALR